MQLLAYNVKMLPTAAKLFERPLLRPWGFWERGPGGIPDHERAAAIADYIAAGPWDVVCLSEVFDRARQAQLEKALGPTHACLHRLGAGQLALSDSGLFVASRLPIVSHEFHRFRAASGADRLAAKGIVHVVIDGAARGLPALHVFATHLQAHQEGAKARAAQIAEARAFIVRSLEGASVDAGHAAVLLGDLNVCAEEAATSAPTAEYGALCTALEGARDVFRRTCPSEPGFTWDGVANGFMTGDQVLERLDYLFAFERTASSELTLLECSGASVLRPRHGERHLSDHFALDATLRVAKR